ETRRGTGIGGRLGRLGLPRSTLRAPVLALVHGTGLYRADGRGTRCYAATTCVTGTSKSVRAESATPDSSQVASSSLSVPTPILVGANRRPSSSIARSGSVSP